uniref:Uncharacterized protein n=1 Tax=Glossina pallidipes TaxID=7398 RepID=A0A1A9ZQ12_GLOPL
MEVRKKPTIFTCKNYSWQLLAFLLQDGKKSASRYSAILSCSECKESSGKCEQILRNSRITCGQHHKVLDDNHELLPLLDPYRDECAYVAGSSTSKDVRDRLRQRCAKKIMPSLTQPTVDLACGNSVDLVFKCHVCLIRTVSPIEDMEVLQAPERDGDILSNASDELDNYVVLEFDDSKIADTSSAQSISPFEDLITGSKLSSQVMENCLPKLVNKNSDATSCDDKIDDIEHVVAVISENNADSCQMKEEDKAPELFPKVTEEILLKQDDNISKASCVQSVDRIETFAETSVNNSPLVKSPDSSLRHQKVGAIEAFVDGKGDNKARSFYSLAGISSLVDKTRQFNITSRIIEKLSPKQDASTSGESSCIENSDNEQANADSSRLSRSASPVGCNGFAFSCKTVRSLKISSYNN